MRRLPKFDPEYSPIDGFVELRRLFGKGCVARDDDGYYRVYLNVKPDHQYHYNELKSSALQKGKEDNKNYMPSVESYQKLLALAKRLNEGATKFLSWDQSRDEFMIAIPVREVEHPYAVNVLRNYEQEDLFDPVLNPRLCDNAERKPGDLIEATITTLNNMGEVEWDLMDGFEGEPATYQTKTFVTNAPSATYHMSELLRLQLPINGESKIVEIPIDCIGEDDLPKLRGFNIRGDLIVMEQEFGVVVEEIDYSAMLPEPKDEGDAPEPPEA